MPNRTFDVDKVFIDSPEFQKYFFAGVDTKEGDAEFAKASAIAGIMLDYFDSVMTRLQYNKEHLPEDILQQGAWDHYFDATFRTSPILCRTLMNDPLSYGTEMRRLGLPACGKYHPSQSVAPSKL